MAYYKQLTLDDRILIKEGLDKGLTFRAIAQDLGKDPSSVSREVRRHLIITKKGAWGRPYNACLNRYSCEMTSLCGDCHTKGRRRNCSFCSRDKGCNSRCVLFRQEFCPLLDKPPYVCNGCKERQRCTLEKHIYSPQEAQSEYKDVLSESRTGIAASENEIAELDSIVSPLLAKGQSLYHICHSQPGMFVHSQSTLYRYINDGLLTARNIDLPRKVRFSKRKNPRHHKVDTTCRKGRSYQDFLEWCRKHPDMPVVELDSVEGIKGGKVLLTVYFRTSELQLAFLRDHNNAQSVTEIFDGLYDSLGGALFMKLFPVLIADNGSEFSDPSSLETAPDGSRRTRVFYCDPSAPSQKGGCERNHTEIRRLIPKGTPLDSFTQEDICLMMDHINSFLRLALGGRSAYDTFVFHNGPEAAEILGCRPVNAADVTLKPILLKRRLCDRGIDPATVYKKLIPATSGRQKKEEEKNEPEDE